jgi:DNA-binding IclR family transcriptional regulator
MQQMNGTHRSVEKALEILLSFIPHNAGIGTFELSETLGFHRSTVNRLLHVMEKRGFVEQNPDTKKFVLGHSILELAAAIHQSLSGNLTQIAVPLMEELRNRLGETVIFEIAGPTHTNIAYIVEGSGPIGIKGSVGDTHGYNAAAGAKAILAYSPSKFQERVLARELPRFTSKTIIHPETLKEQIKKIKAQGFAFDNEERHEGIRAFGCPVLNYEKKPVGAVVVAGTSKQITWKSRSDIMPALKETAARISEQLYYKNGAM